MNRLLVLIGVVGLCMASLYSNTSYGLERYIAGVHYKIVAPEPSKTPGPQVMSFFSYACPHCNHLEPMVDEWRKKLASDVKFERVPATWNPFFVEMAKLYHALNILGLADTHGAAVFDEIHKKKRSLHAKSAVLAFMQTLGVDKALAEDTYSSKAVEKRLREDRKIMAQYKISGVPSFVVNGRFFVDIRSAGSKEDLFEVLNFLLTK